MHTGRSSPYNCKLSNSRYLPEKAPEVSGRFLPPTSQYLPENTQVPVQVSLQVVPEIVQLYLQLGFRYRYRGRYLEVFDTGTGVFDTGVPVSNTGIEDISPKILYF